MRLDGHLHLGEIYNSKSKGSKQLYVSPEELAAFINKYEITHAIVIYTNIKELRKLQTLTPAKLYPVKWVIDPNNLAFNEETVGIKLHHIRGLVNGVNMFEDYDDRCVTNMLKNLPDGFLVCFHTQGRDKIADSCRPLAIAKHAIAFPKLKFIIYHAGNYSLHSYYPIEISKLTHVAMSAETAIFEACLISKKIPNVYVEASMLISPNHFKTQLLIQDDVKLMLGSDYPFMDEISPGRICTQQEKLLKRTKPSLDINELHQRAIAFIEGEVI